MLGSYIPYWYNSVYGSSSCPEAFDAPSHVLFHHMGASSHRQTGGWSHTVKAPDGQRRAHMPQTLRQQRLLAMRHSTSRDCPCFCASHRRIPDVLRPPLPNMGLRLKAWSSPEAWPPPAAMMIPMGSLAALLDTAVTPSRYGLSHCVGIHHSGYLMLI